MFNRLADAFCCFIHSKSPVQKKYDKNSEELNTEANIIVSKVLQDCMNKKSAQLESQIDGTDDTVIFTK